jgi:hypothetical protein
MNHTLSARDRAIVWSVYGGVPDADRAVTLSNERRRLTDACRNRDELAAELQSVERTIAMRELAISVLETAP